MQKISFLLLILATAQAFARTIPFELSASDFEKPRSPIQAIERKSDVTIKKYVVKIHLTPDQSAFQGEVRIAFSVNDPRTTEVTLDMASQLTLDQIDINGSPAKYQRQDDELEVHLPYSKFY